MNTTRNTPTSPGERRGNALVLVAGALVLLVIIASAYLSSAQGIRQTAKAQRRTVNVDAAAGVIAEDIAREISEALFVREIDPTLVDTTVGSSSMVQSLLNIAPLPPEVSSRFLEDPRRERRGDRLRRVDVRTATKLAVDGDAIPPHVLAHLLEAPFKRLLGS